MSDKWHVFNCISSDFDDKNLNSCIRYEYTIQQRERKRERATSDSRDGYASNKYREGDKMRCLQV